MLGVCYYPEHWPEDLVGRGRATHARTRDCLRAYRANLRGPATSQGAPSLPGGGLDRAMNSARRRWAEDRARHADSDAAQVADGRISGDIAPIDEQGRPRGFWLAPTLHGRSRHRLIGASSARIVEALAERYGRHAALVGWQTDNEYGCHNIGCTVVGRRGLEWVPAVWLRSATINRPSGSTKPGGRRSGRWRSGALTRSRFRISP